MSSDATPISPTRFATAVKDLPLSALHLKAAELRNSIAHLDYSNEQLKPFADGTVGGTPDQDCLDAIKENEIVIETMQERMRLLREEVEGRGSSWLEFSSAEEVLEERKKEGRVGGVGEVDGSDGRLINGRGHYNGSAGPGQGREVSEAWRDGTFQTGRIVNGEVTMDANSSTEGASGLGGRLDDQALRTAMEERMRSLATEEDGDGGMHL